MSFKKGLFILFLAVVGLCCGAASHFRCFHGGARGLYVLASAGAVCVGSVVVVHGEVILQHVGSPGPGITAVSFTKGGFSITRPPGKSFRHISYKCSAPAEKYYDRVKKILKRECFYNVLFL